MRILLSVQIRYAECSGKSFPPSICGMHFSRGQTVLGERRQRAEAESAGVHCERLLGTLFILYLFRYCVWKLFPAKVTFPSKVRDVKSVIIICSQGWGNSAVFVPQHKERDCISISKYCAFNQICLAQPPTSQAD